MENKLDFFDYASEDTEARKDTEGAKPISFEGLDLAARVRLRMSLNIRFWHLMRDKDLTNWYCEGKDLMNNLIVEKN